MISLRNGLNAEEMEITKHAIERAMGRLKYKTYKEAKAQIRAMIQQAQFIGEVREGDGDEHGLLFAYRRTAFIVSFDRKTVLTTYRRESVTYEPLKDTIRELHAKEYRKLDRKERATQKRLEHEKAELEIELAHLRLRSLKTRSQAVRLACRARINAINEVIAEKEASLKAIQDEKRRVARSMVSVV